MFDVRFPAAPPLTSLAGGTAVLQTAPVLIQASSLPPVVLDSVDVPYFGRRVKLGGDRTFPNWTVTVLNDEDFALRNIFEAWSNLMNTFGSNILATATANPNGVSGGYKVDEVEVRQYTKLGAGSTSNETLGTSGAVEAGVIRSYYFFGMFPLTVDPIPLDWGRNNTIETFDVTFAFDYWVPNTTTNNYTYDPEANTPQSSVISGG